MKGIIWECCEQLYTNKIYNLGEMGLFRETYNSLKLNHEKIKRFEQNYN